MPRAKKNAPRKIAPGPDPITFELHSAIADHVAQPGRTLHALAAEAGLDESSLRRFVSRERGLSLESAGRLCAVLGLKLVRKARARPRVEADQRSVFEVVAADQAGEVACPFEFVEIEGQ